MPRTYQPLTSHQPVFTYLENQLLCLWWRIPIHPCLWSANNPPHPLLALPPFHTPQFPTVQVTILHRRHQQLQSSSSGTVLTVKGLSQEILLSYRWDDLLPLFILGSFYFLKVPRYCKKRLGFCVFCGRYLQQMFSEIVQYLW
jgi:hypothetical protein